jgi:SagB-type dehydrogenase family enzyme
MSNTSFTGNKPKWTTLRESDDSGNVAYDVRTSIYPPVRDGEGLEGTNGTRICETTTYDWPAQSTSTSISITDLGGRKMNLDTFIQNLHFKINKVNPLDWEVDWEDAPLPYKIYRDLPVFPLSLEVPLTLEEPKAPKKPGFRDIGHFLWYVFGLTQFFQFVYSQDSTEHMGGLKQVCRRFVPSGGALYPNELYMYLKIEGLPAGVYHYDVAHHRLILLREGNFDLYLTETLGHRCYVSTCFGTVFVSTMFWKNFFKYNNFAYRLQGLDAGVLIGPSTICSDYPNRKKVCMQLFHCR